MTNCHKCKYFIYCDLFKQIFYLQENKYCDEFKQKEKVEENKDEKGN